MTASSPSQLSPLLRLRVADADVDADVDEDEAPGIDADPENDRDADAEGKLEPESEARAEGLAKARYNDDDGDANNDINDCDIDRDGEGDGDEPRPVRCTVTTTSSSQSAGSGERRGRPRGQRHSEESKRKIGLANRGNVPWNKGRPHSEATKRKIAENTRRAMLRPELRQILKQRALGRRHSEETKLKIGRTARLRGRQAYSPISTPTPSHRPRTLPNPDPYPTSDDSIAAAAATAAATAAAALAGTGFFVGGNTTGVNDTQGSLEGVNIIQDSLRSQDSSQYHVDSSRKLGRGEQKKHKQSHQQHQQHRDQQHHHQQQPQQHEQQQQQHEQQQHEQQQHQQQQQQQHEHEQKQQQAEAYAHNSEVHIPSVLGSHVQAAEVQAQQDCRSQQVHHPAAGTKRPMSEQTKRKLSKRIKEMWADPAYRSRVSTGIQARLRRRRQEMAACKTDAQGEASLSASVSATASASMSVTRAYDGTKNDVTASVSVMEPVRSNAKSSPPQLPLPQPQTLPQPQSPPKTLPSHPLSAGAAKQEAVEMQFDTQTHDVQLNYAGENEGTALNPDMAFAVGHNNGMDNDSDFVLPSCVLHSFGNADFGVDVFARNVLVKGSGDVGDDETNKNGNGNDNGEGGPNNNNDEEGNNGDALGTTAPTPYVLAPLPPTPARSPVTQVSPCSLLRPPLSNVGRRDGWLPPDNAAGNDGGDGVRHYAEEQQCAQSLELDRFMALGSHTDMRFLREDATPDVKRGRKAAGSSSAIDADEEERRSSLDALFAEGMERDDEDDEDDAIASAFALSHAGVSAEARLAFAASGATSVGKPFPQGVGLNVGSNAFSDAEDDEGDKGQARGQGHGRRRRLEQREGQGSEAKGGDTARFFASLDGFQ